MTIIYVKQVLVYLMSGSIYFKIVLHGRADIFSEILFKMTKAHAYMVGGLLIISSVLISTACTKTTETDDDLIGNWKRSNDFRGNGRSEAVCFTIGDYAYITTGVDASSRYKDMFEYNTVRKFWTQLEDFGGVARSSAVAFSIGTKGYVGTGYDGVSYLNDFWEYDQVSGHWTEVESLPDEGRHEAVAFTLNGKGYVACGNDGNFLATMWEYNPGADEWNQKPDVTGSKRSSAMAFVYNNKAYILSGNNNGQLLRDVRVYDPVTEEWTDKTRIDNYSEDSFDDDYGGIPRQNAVMFTIGDHVYMTSGENSSGSIISTTWEYDPESDIWTQKTAFEGTGRTGAVAFTLNNRGFVLTGRSGSLNMDDMYELLPNDEQADDD